MKDQVLSVRRMKHLKKLGVDISKANIYWARREHGFRVDDDSKGNWFLSLQKEFTVCGFTHFEVIPALTLQGMIELMPEYIGDCALIINPGSTSYQYKGAVIKEFHEEGILINTYNMLCWLAENNFLTEEYR